MLTRPCAVLTRAVASHDLQVLLRSRALTDAKECKLVKYMPVRLTSSGHFFLVTGVLRVLPGFSVAKNGYDVEISEDKQAALQAAASVKYFGHNPGYFTYSDKTVLVQIWHPEFGIVVAYASVENVAELLSVDLDAADIVTALGENAQVQA